MFQTEELKKDRFENREISKMEYKEFVKGK